MIIFVCRRSLYPILGGSSMRFFIFFLLVFFPLNGFSYSTGPEQAMQEEWLIHTQKWKDYIEGLEINIPGNVVKEFASVIKDKPMPDAKKLRFGMFLQTPNGKRVKVGFKKNGEITFNGKPWRFKPLATIDSEVKRLADHITGADQRALLEYLLPKAHASEEISEDVYGLAAAAFAAGYSWRAHACMAERLDGELLEDCIMMGAPIRSITDFTKLSWGGRRNIVRASLSTSDWESGKAFVATSLSCPEKLPGTIEWVITNKYGDSEKSSGNFKTIKDDSNPVHVYFSKRQEKYKEVTLSSDAKTVARFRMAAILETVCLAKTVEKEKFMAIIRENKSKQRGNETPDKDEFFTPTSKGLKDAA